MGFISKLIDVPFVGADHRGLRDARLAIASTRRLPALGRFHDMEKKV